MAAENVVAIIPGDNAELCFVVVVVLHFPRKVSETISILQQISVRDRRVISRIECKSWRAQADNMWNVKTRAIIIVIRGKISASGGVISIRKR